MCCCFTIEQTAISKECVEYKYCSLFAGGPELTSGLWTNEPGFAGGPELTSGLWTSEPGFDSYRINFQGGWKRLL